MAGQKYNKREIGARREREAGAYLEGLGYRIVRYNFRCRTGAVDIIACDGDCLVFCEVKYRAGSAKGHPLEAVGTGKQKTISRCASYYLVSEHLGDVPCRFDVVGIEGKEITLIKNAFEYAGR